MTLLLSSMWLNYWLFLSIWRNFTSFAINSVISHIQRNPQKLFRQCTVGKSSSLCTDIMHKLSKSFLKLWSNQHFEDFAGIHKLTITYGKIQAILALSVSSKLLPVQKKMCYSVYTVRKVLAVFAVCYCKALCDVKTVKFRQIEENGWQLNLVT